MMIDEKKAAENRAARMEKKRAYLRAIYDRHVERLRALKVNDAMAVARDMHARIDGLLGEDQEKNPFAAGIRCRKGCSHCCRGPVEISTQEAMLLIDGVRKAGRELDESRLERQSRQTVETWRQQPAADRACVFLGDDGACTVYESRPAACRKLLVTSDPEFCDAERNEMERIERWFNWEAEMMASAAVEVFGVTLMPKALLDARRGKPAQD